MFQCKHESPDAPSPAPIHAAPVPLPRQQQPPPHTGHPQRGPPGGIALSFTAAAAAAAAEWSDVSRPPTEQCAAALVQCTARQTGWCS